jgi:hypothetical protein
MNAMMVQVAALHFRKDLPQPKDPNARPPKTPKPPKRAKRGK